MTPIHGPEVTEERPTGERIEEVFRLHERELLGTLRYLVGNWEDARDALQGAFLNCWKRRDHLAEVANLKAWIFQVAINSGRDLRRGAWRRRRRSIEGETDMLVTTDGRPDVDVQRTEQLDRLHTAIQSLRAEEKEVFLLRQNGELTYEQIGTALGMPVGTVKTRMRLAIEKLRLALRGD